MWIIIGFVLIVISIFDWIPVSIAKLLGFELTSNFVMSLAIFFLLVIVFFTYYFHFQAKGANQAVGARTVHHEAKNV